MNADDREDGVYRNDLFGQLLAGARDHLQQQAAYHMDIFALMFSDVYRRRVDGPPVTESPIEAGFEVWWHALQTARAMEANPFEFVYELERQTPVACRDRTYRVDFRVRPSADDAWIGHAASDGCGVACPKIGIELDGHDFHEKTKEQATYRNQRDRDLQAAGWMILHVSGSELVRDPLGCVTDVRGVANSVFHTYASALVRATRAREGVAG